jgi:Ca2+-binding RTX toxin-like protein
VIAGTTLVASNASYAIPDELPGVLFGPQFAESAAALFDSAHPVRCGRKLASIVGNEESDRLVGTSGPDVILGDRGNDTIMGKGGRDKLCGEEGRDKLKGGGGKDLCEGGPSRDRSGRCEKEKSVAG